jgi:hypothetical protein
MLVLNLRMSKEVIKYSSRCKNCNHGQWYHERSWGCNVHNGFHVDGCSCNKYIPSDNLEFLEMKSEEKV